MKNKHLIELLKIWMKACFENIQNDRAETQRAEANRANPKSKKSKK